MSADALAACGKVRAGEAVTPLEMQALAGAVLSQVEEMRVARKKEKKWAGERKKREAAAQGKKAAREEEALVGGLAAAGLEENKKGGPSRKAKYLHHLSLMAEREVARGRKFEVAVWNGEEGEEKRDEGEVI